MKILVADDERLIRVNLISMIQELYGSVHSIDEAKDGSELQKKLIQDIYDLVFVDINMPKKSGLDVMKEYQTENKNLVWCVLSGYADFEYARRAISLGVKEYLLKPVDIDDLRQFIDSVISENEKRKKKEHLLYEKNISQAFVLADALGLIEPIKLLDDAKEYSLFVFILDASDNHQRQHIYGKLYQNLSVYMQKYIDPSDRFALFIMQTGELCLLIEGREYGRIHSYLQIHAEKYKNARIVAFYTKNKDFQSLYDEKQQILELISVHMLENNLSVLSLQELQERSDPSRRELCEKIEQITSCYLTENYAEALDIYRGMESDERLKSCYDTINTEALLSYLSVVWNVTFQCESYSEMLYFMKQNIQEQLRFNRGLNNQLIHQIKDYVKNNYMDNMSITEISDHFNITPSYISRIFKEKTGEKLIDYITGVRMKKARELLLYESSLSMKEVASRVGYTSEKHFSKIFKKYYNCLPSRIAYEGVKRIT